MNTLPRSYKELNYKTYIKILQTLPAEKPEHLDAIEWSKTINLAMLSILTGSTPEQIENLRHVAVAEMLRTIDFLNHACPREKCKFKIKNIDTLTYDEFTTYQMLRLEQWENLPAILSIMLIDHTPEQIDKLSAYDAMQIFFLLSDSTRKFLRRSKYSTLMKATRQTIAGLWSKKNKSPKQSSATVGNG